MKFGDYQGEARKTAIYPNRMDNMVYPTLGLCGEAGEVAEKVKKYIRDNGDIRELQVSVKKELGDVLWYIAALCDELGLTMEGIAEENIAKLQSRQERNVIHGDGDDR